MNNVIVQFVQKVDGVIVSDFDPILISFQMGKNGNNASVTKESVSTVLDTFTDVTPTFEDSVILGGGKKATVEEVLALVPAYNPEIYIGPDQPASTYKIWVQTNPSDIDILRAIRENNTQSNVLTSLFDDTKNPLLEWWDNDNYKGAIFGGNPHIQDIANNNGVTLPDVLNPKKCYFLYFYSVSLRSLDIDGLSELLGVYCGANEIGLMGVSQIGNIVSFDFTHNYMSNDEVNRLVNLGFDINFINPQNVAL